MKPLRLSTQLQPERSLCGGRLTWTSLVCCTATATMTHMHISCVFTCLPQQFCMDAKVHAICHSRSQCACTLACLHCISYQRHSGAAVACDCAVVSPLHACRRRQQHRHQRIRERSKCSSSSAGSHSGPCAALEEAQAGRQAQWPGGFGLPAGTCSICHHMIG